jgi:hypothetical protein
MSVDKFVGMTDLNDNFFDDWVAVSEPRQEEKDQEAFVGTTNTSVNTSDDICDDNLLPTSDEVYEMFCEWYESDASKQFHTPKEEIIEFKSVVSSIQEQDLTEDDQDHEEHDTESDEEEDLVMRAAYQSMGHKRDQRIAIKRNRESLIQESDYEAINQERATQAEEEVGVSSLGSGVMRQDNGKRKYYQVYPMRQRRGEHDQVAGRMRRRTQHNCGVYRSQYPANE